MLNSEVTFEFPSPAKDHARKIIRKYLTSSKPTMFCICYIKTINFHSKMVTCVEFVLSVCPENVFPDHVGHTLQLFSCSLGCEIALAIPASWLDPTLMNENK